ncbi:MAG: diguanylate cyclase [Melioribacteraceae bacterium]|nr:diguanylate cyclase [Melioribacteraceae bacterium]
MGIPVKLRKRILIFLFIPIISIIPYLTEDIYIRLASTILLLLYVGFIIFLRDSGQGPQFGEEPSDKDTDDEIEPDVQDKPVNSKNSFETDFGEDFKIISANKKLEVITADTYVPGKVTQQQNFFKPRDLKETFDRIATEVVPEEAGQDEQFGFVLEKILSVAKEAFMAHTAVFFWFNGKKEKLTLEKFISSSQDITKQKFDLENDILSKIIQNEEPELLTDITPNAETDVIRYYSLPQGIKSFVGVPLFFGKHISGILALDSKMADAFGIETIYSLGRIVRVISIIIGLFDEKFEDSKAEQRLKALLGILVGDKKFDNQTELFNTIENSVKTLIPWDAFTLVYFDASEKKFLSKRIVNKTSLKYIGENLQVELDGTLVGKTILTGTPVKIDDTSLREFKRYSPLEDVSFDGSFLAIPLVYDDQYYGALCFESLKKNLYHNSDVRFMKNASKIFSHIVFSYSSQNILKGLLSIDVETRALNYDNFMDRLASDLSKANSINIQGAITLIKIDDFIEQETLFENDPFPKVLKSVADVISEEMSDTTIFGRLDNKLFCVYFFNVSAKDVYLWAEKLRVKIARKPISVALKQTTFTISAGVASTDGKTDVEEVIRNAELALDKAISNGGNQVKSIN